jgi:hypothetical protein
MYLTTETVSILKNLATINQSILIKPGQQLRTISPMKTILCEAEITETFSREVAIYDLNQFLNCLSLVPGAEIQLEETALRIANDTQSILYRYSEPAVINSPPDKSILLPSEDVCVVLKEDDIISLTKASAVLQIPDISFVGDKENIVATVNDKKNSGSNSFTVDLGETESEFKFNIKIENLKLIPGDYDVVFSAKNLARFTNHSRPIVYHIALEPDSTFES